MTQANYSYSISDDNIMTVFENDKVLCTVCDVHELKAKDIFYDVVYEMRNIDLEQQ